MFHLNKNIDIEKDEVYQLLDYWRIRASDEFDYMLSLGSVKEEERPMYILESVSDRWAKLTVWQQKNLARLGQRFGESRTKLENRLNGR